MVNNAEVALTAHLAALKSLCMATERNAAAKAAAETAGKELRDARAAYDVSLKALHREVLTPDDYEGKYGELSAEERDRE